MLSLLYRARRGLESPSVHGPLNITYRNLLAYRSMFWVIVSGFFEPVLYLVSIGVGVGQLVQGFDYHGEPLGYTAFVTARRHFHRYLPFPGVLPVVELGYGDFSLYATYIPGGRTDGRRYGNIAFVMGRYAF